MTSLTAPSHSDNVRNKLSSDPHIDHMRCPADDAETLTTATSTPRLLLVCARVAVGGAQPAHRHHVRRIMARTALTRTLALSLTLTLTL